MKNPLIYYRSSIGKRQISSLTELILISIIVFLLAGNFFIYSGPESYNKYFGHLLSAQPWIYIFAVVVGLTFLFHMLLNVQLILKNMRARGTQPYRRTRSKQKQYSASRLLPFTGCVVFLFFIYYMLEFLLSDPHGPKSVLLESKSCGYYGIVYNSFSDPIQSSIYIIVMIVLGFHLSHYLQSMVQTWGSLHLKNSGVYKNVSNFLGIYIALTYSTVPIYVMVLNVI